jgi:hypothetical protein
VFDPLRHHRHAQRTPFEHEARNDENRDDDDRRQTQIEMRPRERQRAQNQKREHRTP